MVGLDYARPAFDGEAVVGMIPIHDGPFGNVWTNIDLATFARLGVEPGGALAVEILHEDAIAFAGRLPFVTTFGDVGEGEALVYANSAGTIALAINLGSFAGEHGIGYGPDWRVELRRTPRP